MKDVAIQDRIKRHYQRTLGAEHLVPDADAAVASLEAECAALASVPFEEPLFEPLGGGVHRMHLRPLMRTGLSQAVAGRMFVYAARHAAPDRVAFAAGLDALAETDADRDFLRAYRAQGCPALHHSEAFRARYRPAYRIVTDALAHAFPLILRADGLAGGIIAIDGPCAGGKSTLAKMLGDLFGAPVLPMDDFFLRPHQRTRARLSEPGGNVDRERFFREVLTPLREGYAFAYRPYDCAAQALAAPIVVPAARLAIVEGAYSLHPDLRDAYALTCFLDAGEDVQRARLLARNGAAMLKRFETEWIPLERRYFDAFSIRESADLRLPPQACAASN